MNTHYASIWEQIADQCGDQNAVIQGPRLLSWEAFENRSARLASVMQQAGLKPDSKVATYLYNCPELLEARFAALKQCYVPVNVNYRYVADEVLYILDNSDSEAVFFHSSLAHIVEAVRPHAPNVRLWIEVKNSDDHLDGALLYEDCLGSAEPAQRINRSPDGIQLIYTGGTTGLPKGVMIRIGNAVASGLGLAANIGIPLATPENAVKLAVQLSREGNLPRSLVPCPLIHGTGLQLGANPYLTVGGCIIFPTSQRFDAAEVWQEVDRLGATHMTIVGEPMARPLLKALLEQPDVSASSLAYLASSGAMFSRETKEALVQRLPKLTIFDLMSSTEGSLGKSFYSKDSTPETSRFILNPAARVFDDDDHEIEPGSEQVGHLAVSGAIPLGYYKDPEKTARTFRLINGTVWSFPGDYASVDTSGQIKLLGRGSSVINTGGEKVFVEEVEEAIKRVMGVDDCLVFGLAHQQFGQQVTALVSPRSFAGKNAMKDRLLKVMAAYKVPKLFFYTDAVPRGPNGKADYSAARRMAEENMNPNQMETL